MPEPSPPESPRPEPPEPTAPHHRRRRIALRVALIGVLLGALTVGILQVDFTPDLSHLDVTVLSGAEGGRYHATVEALGERAADEGGEVHDVSTAGSMENLERLAADGCEAELALVQDGLDWTDAAPDAYRSLTLVARLPRAETLLFLGRDADLVSDFRELAGMRIGAGPAGSGTAAVLEGLFALPGFEGLGVERVHGPVAEQLARARAGELDLAAMVVFPDAAIVERAVRDDGLRIASFARAEAVAAHLPGVRAGALSSGHFDAVAGVPSRDVSVLVVDTLLVAGPCAERSQINGVLSLLARELPGFVAHNREVPPPPRVATSEVAREFFENHGPPLVDQYLPRVVDVIPLSNAMTLVMAISVLFNVMSLMNRFRLWRLDARRHKLEDELRELFGGGITRKEIDLLDPDEVLAEEDARAKLADLVGRLDRLLERCRDYATSMLVPMGQEMVYRYQESLIVELLASLRRLQRRHERGARAAER